MAAAGRARFMKLGQHSVRRYVRDLLVEYAKLQRFKPKIGARQGGIENKHSTDVESTNRVHASL
jgi:hypothetical protein